MLLWIISQNSWYITLTAVEFWAWLGIDSGAALDTCRIGRFCIYPLISFRDLDIVGLLVVGVLVQREYEHWSQLHSEQHRNSERQVWSAIAETPKKFAFTKKHRQSFEDSKYH